MAASRPLSGATPIAAGISVVLAATALAGVVAGLRWLAFVTVAVAVVVIVGVLLRPLTLPGGRRLPAVLVVLAQLLGLTSLATAVFPLDGFLALVPTPGSMSRMRDLLSTAMTEVEVGVPPVTASTEMLLLITLALGLVAVVVDCAVVAMRAPASAGLVLLCVFAVPASVAESMLPWWTFVLGAGGFAALLAVDGQYRHLVWRGETSAPSDSASTQTATTVAGIALVSAMLAGSLFTVVGTIEIGRAHV